MKSIVYIGTSLDGFIARKDGDIDWLVQFANEEAILAYEEFINRIDAIVIGRGSFEKVLSFPSWPYNKKVFVLSTSIKHVPYILLLKVIFLYVGLDLVYSIHYAGWKGELLACENDARYMETIATSQGFVPQSLLTKAATSTAVLGVMEKAAKELFEDDFFLLTYSGHGGQINDAGNDEPDGLDETWVLFDRQLVDDELYAAWSLFRPSMRVLVLSDSCHSGTMTKAMLMYPTP
jgi:hypothetical protein